MKHLTIALLGFWAVISWSCQKIERHIVKENAVIEGEVISLITGESLEGAEVKLCYHETMMLQEGLFIGGMSCDTADVAARTDTNGGFRISAFADTSGLPTYVWIQVVHPDFEVMHEVYFRLRAGRNDFGTLAMRKKGQFTRDKYKQLRKNPNHHPRKGEVFDHDTPKLEQLYPLDLIANLPTAAECIPHNKYVKVYNLKRGYNGRPSNFNLADWKVHTAILLPTDLAVAGVTEGEVGLFTDHPEALKTQAIWARTYALHKGLKEKMPQNLQLAFSTSIADYSLQASKETRDTILSHKYAPGGPGNPILSVFSAQCNGDFTQSGERAKWGKCRLGGNWSPYLIAVPCSQHPNCYQSGMNNDACCNINSEWKRYLYGHGAGGCQHGMKDFAETGWSHRKIASYYFHGSRLQAFQGNVWNNG